MATSKPRLRLNAVPIVPAIAPRYNLPIAGYANNIDMTPAQLIIRRYDSPLIATGKGDMTAKPGEYDVVWPRSQRMVGVRPLARRLDSLEGKKVAQLWDYLFRGDEVFSILEDGLSDRYRGLEFISWREFGNTHGEDEAKVLAGLPARLKQMGVSAVVSGMGC
jgi:hypothetical protein